MVINTRPKDAGGFLNEFIATTDNLINAGMSTNSNDLYDQYPSNP